MIFVQIGSVNIVIMGSGSSEILLIILFIYAVVSWVVKFVNDVMILRVGVAAVIKSFQFLGHLFTFSFSLL